jgi:glycosyltransferase involved in cell wall biosynthesis
VLSQGYSDLQYIVIDGGSADGSQEIIRRYSRHLSYWQSAPDGGQSDALRQGFSRATGEVMNWLNSDDVLAPAALSHVAALVRAHPGAGLYAAATENFFDRLNASPRYKSIPENLDVDTLLFRSGRIPQRHQPGIFFRRSLYEAVGGVDPSKHYCMDLQLYLQMLESGASVAYDDRTVAYFRMHGGSKTAGTTLHVARLVREYMSIADTAAARLRVVANHRPHLRWLLGGMRVAIWRGQWREAAECLTLAAEIGGPAGILREAAAALGRAASIVLLRPQRRSE